MRGPELHPQSERGFGNTLAVGVIAGVTLPFFVSLASPPFGDEFALSLHWALAVVGYLMVLVTGARRRFVVAVVGGIVAALVLALASSATEVIVGATGALAVARSGWLYRARPAPRHLSGFYL